MNNRKVIRQDNMQSMLAGGEIVLSPLTFRCIRQEPVSALGLDAIVEARWDAKCWRFGVAMKAQSTPKMFRAAVNTAKGARRPADMNPMIMLPYLSADQLRELEQEQVSGVDLCGNGIVLVPGKVLVVRTGQPNRYPSSAPIKNIYRRNSSMVPRVFLTRPVFDRVSDVLVEINRRNLLVSAFRRSPMAMGTVSKAIKAMEEDLLISRQENRLRSIQPEKLLDKLLDSYRPDKAADTIRRRVSLSVPELPARLTELGRELNLPIVATGLGSATRYAVMQRGELLSVYCSRPETLLARLPGGESDRFPNLEVVFSEDETVYFDARLDDAIGFRWASPAQTWLEMMRGDKRDQETAGQVKAAILREAEGMP